MTDCPDCRAKRRELDDLAEALWDARNRLRLAELDLRKAGLLPPDSRDAMRDRHTARAVAVVLGIPCD